MKIKFAKEIYPKSALMKSAYNFTDRAYIHIDSDEKYYIVEITLKDKSDSFDIRDFKNEMLAQSVRLEISIRTKNIRELIIARAMASTLVGEKVISETEHEENFDMDCILKDWFENENC